MHCPAVCPDCHRAEERVGDQSLAHPHHHPVDLHRAEIAHCPQEASVAELMPAWSSVARSPFIAAANHSSKTRVASVRSHQKAEARRNPRAASRPIACEPERRTNTAPIPLPRQDYPPTRAPPPRARNPHPTPGQPASPQRQSCPRPRLPAPRERRRILSPTPHRMTQRDAGHADPAARSSLPRAADQVVATLRHEIFVTNANRETDRRRRGE